jgi:aspartyl-tRNA(Asn)/glutamyl-tRNA(Gln) amidotransferase subunit A
MIDLTTASARSVATQVTDRRTTAAEVTRAALDRIARFDPALHAFIATNPEAVNEAEQVDRRVAAGESLPLAGVPLAVKDSFHVKGMRTTAGSKVLKAVAERDATVVARLRAAGCVVVGKTSMHEFAFGFTNRNTHFGDCKNPWDPARIPGGSSGGNAVALAASLALAAVGGDTGGSIRMPAALCGIAGLKVTYGRVSRAGGLPLCWSMDTVGPMARDVGDLAALLRIMAGPDPDDPVARPGPVPDYLGALAQRDLRGVRIGLPHNHFFETLEPDVAAAVHEAVETLKTLGATMVNVAVPPIEPIRGAHRAILFSEASAAYQELVRNHARDFDPDILRLLQAGHFFTAPEYLAAQQARRKIVADYRKLWAAFDVLIAPTSPIAATPIEATTVNLGGQERELVLAYLDHTLPFNLTGQPSLAIPCGFTQQGLPVGFQVVGRPFDEQLLFRVGACYQTATTWHNRRPPLDRLKPN